MVLLIDVLKGAAAIVFARWFFAWLYTLPSAPPPPTLDLQTGAPWAICLAGLAALLGMLNSCASNVTVVNIDNGFGAGYAASLMNRL